MKVPFLDLPRDDLVALQAEVEAWDADAVPVIANLSPFLTPHEGVHRVIRLYLLGVISARLGDVDDAMAYAIELETLDRSAEERALAVGLSQAVRLHAGRSTDTPEESLERIKLIQIVGAGWERNGQSGFYSRAYEYYLRAKLLNELGRYEEALICYKAVGVKSFHDIIYYAHSHLRRGEIYERLGERERAIEHYRIFVELWEDCDDELRPQFEAARQRLAALENA